MVKEAKKGSILKKVFATVISLGVVAGGFFVAKNVIFNNNTQDPPPISERALLTPEHLSFNDSSYMLTWDEVEHADQYKVNVNGNDVATVNENEYEYTPTTETTTFKVQAFDSTGEYLSSNWSDTITYTITIENNKVTEVVVNNFVNNLDNDALQNVVGMYLEDGNMYVQAVYKHGGKDVLKTKCVEYSTPVSSLEDAITKEYKDVRTVKTYVVSSYKSMESLLKSGSFAGQMEELNQQGYEFSIVKSQTVENPNGIAKNNSMIFAVIRAEKDGTVKYFQTEIECYVTSPSTHQEINYTTKLENPSSREVYENSFNELTDDMYDFYDNMCGKTATKNAPTSYTYSTQTQDSGYSM